MAFCGAYDDQDSDPPTIGYGHSSDRKSHRRQLKVAHATTATGIPLFGSRRRRCPSRGRRDRRTARDGCAASPHQEGCCWWPTPLWSTRPTWPPPTAARSGLCPVAPQLRLRGPTPCRYPLRSGAPSATARSGSRRLRPADRPSFLGAEATIDIIGPDNRTRPSVSSISTAPKKPARPELAEPGCCAEPRTPWLASPGD